MSDAIAKQLKKRLDELFHYEANQNQEALADLGQEFAVEAWALRRLCIRAYHNLGAPIIHPETQKLFKLLHAAGSGKPVGEEAE